MSQERENQIKQIEEKVNDLKDKSEKLFKKINDNQAFKLFDSNKMKLNDNIQSLLAMLHSNDLTIDQKETLLDFAHKLIENIENAIENKPIINNTITADINKCIDYLIKLNINNLFTNFQEWRCIAYFASPYTGMSNENKENKKINLDELGRVKQIEVQKVEQEITFEFTFANTKDKDDFKKVVNPIIINNIEIPKDSNKYKIKFTSPIQIKTFAEKLRKYLLSNKKAFDDLKILIGKFKKLTLKTSPELGKKLDDLYEKLTIVPVGTQNVQNYFDNEKIHIDLVKATTKFLTDIHSSILAKTDNDLIIATYQIEIDKLDKPTLFFENIFSAIKAFLNGLESLLGQNINEGFSKSSLLLFNSSPKFPTKEECFRKDEEQLRDSMTEVVDAITKESF